MKRSLGLMNVSVLAAFGAGYLWGFATDDHAMGRDPSFYFFSGLVLASISGVSASFAWRLAPEN